MSRNGKTDFIYRGGGRFCNFAPKLFSFLRALVSWLADYYVMLSICTHVIFNSLFVQG